MIKVEDLMVGNLVKVIGTESVFTDGEICSVESVDRIYGVASLKGIDWGIEECGFLKNRREIAPFLSLQKSLRETDLKCGKTQSSMRKID